MNMRRGDSQNKFVVKGTVFGCLKEVYSAFPDLNMHFGLDEMGHLKMHANIGQWERELASRVLGPRGDRAEDGAIVSLDTYWRTLVGNRTALSAGDSEFTCATLYALRDFHVRMMRLKEKLEELNERYGSYDAVFSEGGYNSTKNIRRPWPFENTRRQWHSRSRNMGEVQVGRQLFTTADALDLETWGTRKVMCERGRWDVQTGGCGIHSWDDER
ncbi:hypothetical protein FJTKL_05171 [Diaporthe vaccinii]|uniref:Uncharacterized protein n=1 Tax=Diaporthe vaccinii TaxID=105482 RepID=A0ABR4FFB6_9PEZI